MQFKTIVALALAGTAFAAPELKRADPTATDAAAVASVYAILATALPSSLVQLGVTNPGALATEINSELAAGKATWFTQLPTDVQSYLKSVGESQYHLTASVASATGASSASATITGASSAHTTASAGASSAAASGNSTISTGSLSSTKASGSASASKSGTAASSASTGGASMPTAVIGAGVAGALGFIGMLAL